MVRELCFEGNWIVFFVRVWVDNGDVIEVYGFGRVEVKVWDLCCVFNWKFNYLRSIDGMNVNWWER